MSKDLKEVKEYTMKISGKQMFEAERTADAKALREEAVHIFIQGTSRRPAEVGQSEQLLKEPIHSFWLSDIICFQLFW